MMFHVNLFKSMFSKKLLRKHSFFGVEVFHGFPDISLGSGEDSPAGRVH